MSNQQTINSNATNQDEGLGRLLGACAVVGVGLVVASLAPAASPLSLAVQHLKQEELLAAANGRPRNRSQETGDCLENRIFGSQLTATTWAPPWKIQIDSASY